MISVGDLLFQVERFMPSCLFFTFPALPTLLLLVSPNKVAVRAITMLFASIPFGCVSHAQLLTAGDCGQGYLRIEMLSEVQMQAGVERKG